MQNRNANLAVRVYIRVPHFSLEYHLRRIIWIVLWEFELCLEVSAFVERVFGSLKYNIPDEQVVIILKANGSRDIVPVLAIFELLGEHLHCIVPVICRRARWVRVHHVFKSK